MSLMNENEEDTGITRTTIEINKDLWRRVRGEAVREGKQVSEKLEEILEEYFEET